MSVSCAGAERRALITGDAEELTAPDTVLAGILLVCIMDALHSLARDHGTGELHEHEYLRFIAQ